MHKVFLIDIVPVDLDPYEINYRFLELENLVKTYGGAIILKKYQRRAKPDYKTFIGKGKLEEIKHQMEMEGADLLIVGDNLKGSQIYNIEETLRPIGAKVWDRIDLILKIFEKNAKSTESRLQTELAAIKHMGPRIFGMGMDLSRQGGGIGTRGKGETNVQIMKKHIKDSEKKIEKKLKQYSKTRQIHRESRIKKGLSTASIVGYTNAGKSTLLNSITKKGSLAENKLFATLGTSVGSFYIRKGDKGTEVLLNDTIGFISNLPPQLIKSFASTLEDSIESQLLIHLIDSTDKKVGEKIKIVDKILNEIGADQKRLYVFNKIDELNEEELDKIKSEFEYLNPLFISAYKKIGLDELKDKIADILI